MKQKHVDMMREVRLWVGQLVIPAVTAGVVLLTNPNVQNKLEELKHRKSNKDIRY